MIQRSVSVCVPVCQLSELVMYEDFARIWCVIIKRVTPILHFKWFVSVWGFFKYINGLYSISHLINVIVTAPFKILVHSPNFPGHYVCQCFTKKNLRFHQVWIREIKVWWLRLKLCKWQGWFCWEIILSISMAQWIKHFECLVVLCHVPH